MTGRTFAERIESLEANVADHEKQIRGVLHEQVKRLQEQVERLEAELGLNRVSEDVQARAAYVTEERRWAP